MFSDSTDTPADAEVEQAQATALEALQGVLGAWETHSAYIGEPTRARFSSMVLIQTPTGLQLNRILQERSGAIDASALVQLS